MTDAPPRLGRGMNTIGNKMLAVLVAVAVLPAVTVSLYALREATGALSEQALTRISEACVTDARRAEDLLGGVHQDAAALVKENPDLREFLKSLTPGGNVQRTGESEPIDVGHWNTIKSYLNNVDQKLRNLFEQRPSLTLAFVLSFGFQVEGGSQVLRLERSTLSAPLKPCVTRDDAGYLRPLPPPLDAATERVINEWSLAKEEHPERDLLRCTITFPRASPATASGRRAAPREGDGSNADEALEVFAARVPRGEGTDFGWIFLVHSWRAILKDLRGSTEPSANEEFVASLFGEKLEPIASSSAGHFANVLNDFVHQQHAERGQKDASLFRGGEIAAFAPLTPRRDDPSLRYVLAFARPATELVNSVQSFRVVFAEVLAAALLLAALVGIVLARRLTKPLRVLRDGATQIGKGDLAQRLKVRTGDEAEELADEFNAMAAKLNSLYQGMEETIRERTEQLQQALDGLRRAHDQIVESEKRYADIVENASDLIQVTDAAGRIVSANRRQAELFGARVDELKGAAFLDRVAPDAREATRRAFDHVLGGGTLKAFESTLLAEGGARRVPVEISATPVMDDGRPVGVRAILRDVSERKAIEVRLIKAERLSSVGALAAGVAHEINNPLGIITMFAQRVLERAKKGEVDTEKLEKIVEQGKRVAGITRNLLDFARAAPTRFAAFSIGDVIDNTCVLVADRARTAGIRLDKQVAAGLPQVVGNSQQISQVLLNLLLNAFQALGRSGTVTVRASLSPQSRVPTGGPALRVTVEDDGPGIPADVLPRLFEPFFTTKAPGEGTGLGLSVSYGILKEHHGSIFADNRPEGGARFEFELPLDVAAAPVGETKSPIATRREV